MAIRRANAGKKRVTFTVQCATGSTVYLAASFNDWDATAKPMAENRGSGVFKAVCMLAPGAYEYKFVINGEWTVDPNNPNFVVNDLGTLNSVVEVS